MFGEEPQHHSMQQPDPTGDSAPPIVVPPNEPSGLTNAVTRPPPWGEGAVEMDTNIPKSPPVPTAMGTQPLPADRSSEAPRPVELSSSDLSSEARIAAVKAPPIAPAERPHATMAGIGPDVLAHNRAALQQALNAPSRPASPPNPPMSQSDMATNKWAAPAPSLEPPRQPDRDAPVRPAERPARPPSSGAKLHDLHDIARTRLEKTLAAIHEQTKDKPRWVIPVVASAAGFVVLIMFGALVKLALGSSASGQASGATTSSASTTSTTSGSSSPETSAHVSTKPPSQLGRPMVCKTSGSAHTVAPKALVASGVEVGTLGAQFALGFSVAPKEASLEVLDPASLAQASTLRLHAGDNVRRVIALDPAHTAVDVDHKGDRLQGRRTLRGNPPIDVGAMDGGIAWAPHGSDHGIKLWSLVNADAPIEALRGEPLPEGNGYAIAFRQANTIWFGAFTGTPPAPVANLDHVEGLGAQVGSPALATSGERVMVAWADRSASDAPWSVRYASVKAQSASGDQGAQARTFTLPAGGLGEQAMSPGLASLGAGRFLLVWTEGPKSNHQVRSAVLDDHGFGDAFTVSTDGINAGQGQAVVLPDGRGVIAFLAASPSGKGFEVAATPIECTEK
jgi:hypothetical protein